MTAFISLIGIIAVLALLAVLFLLHKNSSAHIRKSTTAEFLTWGISSFMGRQAEQKRIGKEKIVAFLKEKGEAANRDIRDALKLDDRTVVRYMDELEKEGRVQQVGSTGVDVVYKLTP